MSELKIGDSAPDFTLPTDGSGEITLSDLKGSNVVIYFYPKDNTSGCTKESCAFRDDIKYFDDMNVRIIGISKDSVTKHDNFKSKYSLNFPLVSDENSDVCERYGVWADKKMYGNTYKGIERSTFLIDEEGNLAKIWRKVKVTGHIDDVKQAIDNLQNSSRIAAG